MTFGLNTLLFFVGEYESISANNKKVSNEPYLTLLWSILIMKSLRFSELRSE